MPNSRLVMGGLLVGFGTTLGNGCTTGHGVCGLSSKRARSLAATMTFMMCGFVTAMATDTSSYLGGFFNTVGLGRGGAVTGVTIAICAACVLGAYALVVFSKESAISMESGPRRVFILVCELIFGISFGLAMAVSNMTKISATISFLDLRYWNPALAFVMGGAMAITFPVFHFLHKGDSPMLDVKWYMSTLKEIDSKLLIGSATFGVGWGLLGSCPGPAFVNLGSGNLPPVLVCSMMIVGMWIQQAVDKYVTDAPKQDCAPEPSLLANNVP